jgi:hypothetical protein
VENTENRKEIYRENKRVFMEGGRKKDELKTERMRNIHKKTRNAANKGRQNGAEETSNVGQQESGYADSQNHWEV